VRLRFRHQPFQSDAANAVYDVFVGQPFRSPAYMKLIKHIYFVAETKGDMSSMELRKVEEAKAHCAREHFRAISGSNVVYDVVDSYDSLWELVRS